MCLGAQKVSCTWEIKSNKELHIEKLNGSAGGGNEKY